MSNTLADSFFDDLDALDSDSEGEEIKQEIKDEPLDVDVKKEAGTDTIESSMKEEGIDAIIRLRRNQDFLNHMEEVEVCNKTHGKSYQFTEPLELDPIYKLVVKSMQKWLYEIRSEIDHVHKYVIELYSPRFPELKEVVPQVVEYLKVARYLRNDLNKPIREIISNENQVFAVELAVSQYKYSKSGLPQDVIDKVVMACDAGLELVEQRNFLLKFVEDKMNVIAPNLANLVGSEVAARLMGLAGGLNALANIPGCNLKSMGQERRKYSDYRSADDILHAGVIFQSPLVEEAPKNMKQKVAKVLANKAALCASIDFSKSHPSGERGIELHEHVEKHLARLLEPPPAKKKKPLPIPGGKSGPFKKRGGERHRRWKEKFGMTEVRKQANRMAFGEGKESEYGDSCMGRTTGLLGKGGSGQLRVARKKSKLGDRMARLQKKALSGNTNNSHGGLSTSLAMTPIQGLELINPESLKQAQASNSRYFSETSGFATVTASRKRKFPGI
eukprot:TRINITY_DN17347_c1_g4_i1.p1 TRINITY_DN17347_c1_g4~~TRINITY_DN17347_c1_g4_i1.p1  ORF type:complete len:501 (-),score=148.37 TRINITY_DN17347_c1_g4_i1:153-1655(-)